MKEFDPQWNDRMLEAWEEWKEICFVGGCNPDTQRLLETEIYAAFRAKFEIIFKDNVEDFLFTIGNDAPRKDKNEDEWDGENEDNADGKIGDDGEFDFGLNSESDVEIDSEDDVQRERNSVSAQSLKTLWALEFDHGVIETPPPDSSVVEDAIETPPPDSSVVEGVVEFQPLFKCYKDFLWYVKQHSDDPPLKVIRGKLVGPLGIINGIADNYLRFTRPDIWENYVEARNNKNRQKKKDVKQIKQVSIQEEVNEDGDTLGDFIRGGNPVFHEELADIKKEIKAIFTVKELALILARRAKLLTHPETEKFLNAGHTTISGIWNDPTNGLRKKCREHFKFFQKESQAIFIMKNIIAEEKNSKSFLNTFEKAMEDHGGSK